MQEPNAQPQRLAGEIPSLADQRKWQGQLTRDVQASRMLGRSVRFPGPGAADADEPGMGTKATDAGMKAASAGGQAAGAAMKVTSKGVQAAAKGGQAAGRGLTQAGASLSGTGLGAIAGVPMMIAGGALTGASTVAQGVGKAGEVVGEGTQKAAKGVGKFQKARERGRAMRGMMRGGGGGAVGQLQGLKGKSGDMQALMERGGGMAMGGGGTLGALGQAKDAMKGGPAAAMQQAKMLKDLASPMAKLRMAREGAQMAKQLLKDPKLRWKLISRGAFGSGGTVILILIALAPLVSLAFVLLSVGMDFKISGKEWLLMAGLNFVFTLLVLECLAMFGIMLCLLDPICVGEVVIGI